MNRPSKLGAIAVKIKEIEEEKNANVLEELIKNSDVNLEDHPEITFGNNLLTQILRRSVFFVDLNGKNKNQMMFDPVRKIVTSVNMEYLFTNKKELRAKKTYPAIFAYDPLMKSIGGESSDGYPIVNLYEPPAWRREQFYLKKEIQYEASMPEVYDKFFKHLVDNDVDSYRTVINWLAYSLIDRNPTYLVLVGGKGVGKSILGNTILRFLHGEKNYITMTNDSFKNQFNSEIHERTLGYLDELHMARNARHQINKLKLLNNDVVRLERKGQDPVLVKNHLNLYITSNDYEGIPLESDNRRLTIPTCTHTPLKDTELENRIDELQDPANIEKLGRYLLGIVPASKDVRFPFVSKIVEEKIIDANAKEWEKWTSDWILFSLPGLSDKGEVTLEKFQEDFRKENPYSPVTTLGKNRIERYLGEHKELGWTLNKSSSNSEKGIKGYRVFARIKHKKVGTTQ